MIGLAALVLGAVGLYYDRGFEAWQGWGSALLLGPVFLYTAVLGRMPWAGWIEARRASAERRRPAPQVRERAAWSTRLAVGLVVGTMVGAADAILSGSWREGFFGWALPCGVMFGIVALAAPAFGRSRLRLVVVSGLAGAVAGVVSWLLAYRKAGTRVWHAVLIGSLLSAAYAWIESRDLRRVVEDDRG